MTSPTTFRVEGVPPDKDGGVPPRRRRADHHDLLAHRRRRRRPRIRDAVEHHQGSVRADDGAGGGHDRSPRQRARRRRAEHRAPRLRTTIRSWCSCPASAKWRGPRTSSARRRCSSSSWSKAARRRRARRCCRARRRGPVRHGNRHRRRRTPRPATPAPASSSCARWRRSPATTCAAPPSASTRTASRRSCSRSSRTARASSPRSPASNIGRALAIILDSRMVSYPRIDGRICGQRPHRRRLHPAGGGGPRAQAALRRAAGLDELLRGARRRADARPRLDSRRRHRVAGRPVAGHRLHAGATTSSSGINAIVAMVANLIILLGHDGVGGLHDDAARHRRLHPDHRHGRRFERADLRAHQGGAGGAARRARRDRRRASRASAGRSSIPT